MGIVMISEFEVDLNCTMENNLDVLVKRATIAFILSRRGFLF